MVKKNRKELFAFALPLLLLLALWTVDRLFTLKLPADLIWHKEHLVGDHYRARKKLLEEVSEAARRDSPFNYALILGTSRLVNFHPRLMENFFPETPAYNFSAPGASPAYFNYIVEKVMEKNGRAPRYVVLELDPWILRPEERFFALSNSFDLNYVFSYFSWSKAEIENPWQNTGSGFNRSDFERFVAHRLFTLIRRPLRSKAIRRNLKERIDLFTGESDSSLYPTAMVRQKIAELFMRSITYERGGFTVDYGIVPTGNLDQHAIDSLKKFGVNFRISPVEIYFLRKLLRNLARHGSNVMIYWPLQTKRLRELGRQVVDEGEFTTNLQQLISEITAEFPAAKLKLLDYQYDSRFDCRIFDDSYHLSLQCFPLLSELISREIR